MSLKVSTSPPLPDRDMYNHAVYYRSNLPSILDNLKQSALNSVTEASNDTTFKKWSSSRVARKIIDVAYKEFENTVKSKFSHPEYNSILDSSIKYHYTYFYSDLFKLIEEALDRMRGSAGFCLE